MSPGFRLLVVSRKDQREDGTTSHIAGILGTHLSRPLRKAFCLSVCLLAVAVQFAEKVKSSPLTVTSSLYLSLGRAFHPTITLTHRSPRILSSATTKVWECSDLENKFMTDIRISWSLWAFTGYLHILHHIFSLKLQCIHETVYTMFRRK